MMKGFKFPTWSESSLSLCGDNSMTRAKAQINVALLFTLPSSWPIFKHPDFRSQIFFLRDLVNGIKNIIFYELPHYSTFYTDIVNYLDAKKRKSDSQLNPVTCTVLYSKFNILRLSGVVGTQRCSHMISSDKDVHMFYTGEEDD